MVSVKSKRTLPSRQSQTLDENSGKASNPELLAHRRAALRTVSVGCDVGIETNSGRGTQSPVT
jgi:hypothetical protein